MGSNVLNSYAFDSYHKDGEKLEASRVDEPEAGIRITFDEQNHAAANRAVRELQQDLLERTGNRVIASIEKDDEDSQDAGGSTLVLLFGSSAAIAIAQGIRAYLARRGDSRDGIVIKMADGTEVIATGEAARKLDAAALIRAAKLPSRQGSAK